jgi:glycosyltransferase involved in cell wall biosynthesis
MGAESESLPLSVAIITLNEEANLERTLASLDNIAREIIVVDSGSTDRTVEIAEGHGARVLHRDWPGHVAQKNRALEACSQPWVLALDADEPLSPELADAIRALFAQGGPSMAGYWVNRRTWYLGDWVRHAWYPEWRLRLVRRELARWEGQDPHDYLAIDGKTRRLDGDLLHYSYAGVEDHFVRTVKYARVGAEAMIAKGRPFRWHKLVIGPWFRLFRSLVIRQAWRDGWRGWVIAYSSMFAGFLKYAFLLEHHIVSGTRSKRDGNQ